MHPNTVLAAKNYIFNVYTFQLEFESDQYFENILKVEKHDSQKNLKKLREPVRKEK